MISIDIEKYINELKGFAGEAKEMDLYSLKKELINLSQSSNIFEKFEKESMTIGKDAIHQIQDLNALIKIRKFASEIKSKNKINDKLGTLHFNLNILKNSSMNDVPSIKNAINVFLHDEDTKIDNIIFELNDFKGKIDEIKKHHSIMLPKSLDNKLEIENKYNEHIEKLYLMHKKQREILVSTIKLFLKLTKKHLSHLQKFKNMDKKQKG